MTDSNATLKPCPFCGGEAEIIEADYGMYMTGYAVYCIGKCRVKMGVSGRLSEAYEWTPVFDTEAEAVEAWNTRAERTCENTSQYKSLFNCSECKWMCCDTYSCESEFTYCPNCGAKVIV